MGQRRRYPLAYLFGLFYPGDEVLIPIPDYPTIHSVPIVVAPVHVL